MASATHSAKPITIDLRKYKEKENRRNEGPFHSQQTSNNHPGASGSLPKRYQSVFAEGTPLTAFGVRNDDNHPRAHSPPNHMQPQPHHRQLQPVREFLPSGEPHPDDRRRSTSQTNTYTRSQTDATVQNVNAALTRTLNKIRQEPTNVPSTNNARSAPMYAVATGSRPMTARVGTHQPTGPSASSNYYYQLPGGTKGPLPAELITRRPTSSFAANILPNGASHSRISMSTGPLIATPAPTAVRTEIKSSENGNIRTSTPIRPSPKSLEVGLHQLDGFNFDNVTLDDHQERSKGNKHDANQPATSSRSTGRKPSAAPRLTTTEAPQRSLPEVSVNPQMQSVVQTSNDPSGFSHESNFNGLNDDHARSQSRTREYVSTLNSADTHHHHIHVNPTNTPKRISSPVKSQQVVDIQPNVIVQHQRPASRPNSAANTLASSNKDPLNDAYIERDNARANPSNVANRDNDSTPTLKKYENAAENARATAAAAARVNTPPPSPSTKELTRLLKKQRNKYSIKTATAAIVTRRGNRNHRPPGRLKNYDDDSESGSTATETPSRDDDLHRRHGPLPSDLGSDAWSDLTSEFSDTKLRKHPNIRTSTPNITRYSSSVSSKEVGQIRRQLTDLQIMYNDLLKLLDVDIESARGSLKSSNSSQLEQNSRRRFRKVTPVSSFRHANLDMREINQRFTRLESSIVTLAESIAKLSAQIQMQRVIKDDVYHLRQEVAELRQQVHHNQHPRQQSSALGSAVGGGGGRTSSMSTASQQQPSRLISANVQRLAAVNSTNPLNISTSYMPSTSTIQRANSIIDPRQARKIEQFFGTEAMLRYFLSLLNYEEYVPVLEQEKIGFYELPYISERKLQSLGIPYGPCARIIYEAQQYFISLLTLKSSGIDV